MHNVSCTFSCLTITTHNNSSFYILSHGPTTPRYGGPHRNDTLIAYNTFSKHKKTDEENCKHEFEPTILPYNNDFSLSGLVIGEVLASITILEPLAEIGTSKH